MGCEDWAGNVNPVTGNDDAGGAWAEAEPEGEAEGDGRFTSVDLLSSLHALLPSLGDVPRGLELSRVLVVVFAPIARNPTIQQHQCVWTVG